MLWNSGSSATSTAISPAGEGGEQFANGDSVVPKRLLRLSRIHDSTALCPEPMRFRDRILARRDRSSVAASGAELQDLYNTFGFVLTEEQVVPETGPSSIDVGVFHDHLARQGLEMDEDPQPALEQDLLARKVLGRGLDEVPQATLYGLLCFGRDPQGTNLTRGFFVECAAYSGEDRASDVILSGTARGRLDEQIDRTLGWFQALGQRESYGAVQRRDFPILPLKALREAVVNAVAHRDYAILGSHVLLEVFSDRVVVTSPGPLPNTMTAEGVMRGGLPRSRNEGLAHFLLSRGYMEARGRGIPIMRRVMGEFNGTTPILENERGERYVRLTLLRLGK